MKKAVVGVAAIGTVGGLLLAAKRVSHQMREHSEQMKEHCKQMAAHCKEMKARRNGSTEVPSEREVEEIKRQTAAAPTA
jgi:gas vesicle protein